jgi:hypothetical protein
MISKIDLQDFMSLRFECANYFLDPIVFFNLLQTSRNSQSSHISGFEVKCVMAVRLFVEQLNSELMK